jgi:hypothetical protein
VEPTQTLHAKDTPPDSSAALTDRRRWISTRGAREAIYRNTTRIVSGGCGRRRRDCAAAEIRALLVGLDGVLCIEEQAAASGLEPVAALTELDGR